MLIDRTEEKPKWVSPYEKQEERYRQLKETDNLAKYDNRAGVYAITINDVIVYIGKSKNLLRRYAQHQIEIEAEKQSIPKYIVLNQAWKYGFKIGFKQLYNCPKHCDDIEDRLGYREGYFIRKMLPPLNTQVPKEENWHSYTKNPNFDVSLARILDIQPQPYSWCG